MCLSHHFDMVEIAYDFMYLTSMMNVFPEVLYLFLLNFLMTAASRNVSIVQVKVIVRSQFNLVSTDSVTR